jgi:hypothetical protein
VGKDFYFVFGGPVSGTSKNIKLRESLEKRIFRKKNLGKKYWRK